MSLDFSLINPETKEDVFDRNITHNVLPVWRKAGCVEALYRSHGKTAAEILPVVEEAQMLIASQWSDFCHLELPGGKYGSLADAFDFIEAVAFACKEWPEALIDISR